MSKFKVIVMGESINKDRIWAEALLLFIQMFNTIFCIHTNKRTTCLCVFNVATQSVDLCHAYLHKKMPYIVFHPQVLCV